MTALCQNAVLIYIWTKRANPVSGSWNYPVVFYFKQVHLTSLEQLLANPFRSAFTSILFFF